MIKLPHKVIVFFLIVTGAISFAAAQPASLPTIPMPPQANVSAPPPPPPVPAETTVPPPQLTAPPAAAQNNVPPPPITQQVNSLPISAPTIESIAGGNVPSPSNHRPPPVMPSFPSVPRPIHRVRRASHHPTFLQGQRIMLESAPPTNMPPPSPESKAAFSGLLEQNMPLAPQQVVRLRQQIDVAQRAAAIQPNIPPKPVSTTLMINLAPGTTPPVVRLAQGYVSSLVFVDSTGSPWPVASFDIGNPKSVHIQWDGKSNIILIQAISPYSDGNMVIRLVGLPTPLTLEIVAGQRRVDYRVDIHVPGIGPNTKELPVESALPNSANELLLSVLDGVAPPGSRELSVAGADVQAWLLGEKIYLRTRLTILSPGWIGKMVSPDGMLAYEIPRTSSVLISRYGEPAELRIEGF